ncbi:MAG: ribonuclease III [Deltaproteobacteria bacterium]|nr:ribonuclease III [Deltaproteobacteria bacterium]
MNFVALEHLLQYPFHDSLLLQKALTHGSFKHENQHSEFHNERLEFLGDAILDLVISDILMKKFETKREGDLSKMRATLVNEKTLSNISRKLNLGEFLFLGRGEEKSGGRGKDSILACALEAILAAIYLDGGFQKVYEVVAHLFDHEIEDVENHYDSFDYKSSFQQFVQLKHHTTPQYRVIQENGPDHKKIFEVNLVLKSKILSKGQGKSKKEAEQNAAKQALMQLDIL